MRECDRCDRAADDLFWCRRGGDQRPELLCPGCVADLRRRGDQVDMGRRHDTK